MMATSNWKKPTEPVLDEVAVKITLKLIKQPGIEGCNLIAYPDPVSDLYKALSMHGMLNKYMSGKIKHSDLPDNFKALSGAPWTIGWGETNDVKCGDVWTQEEADSRLEMRVRRVMTDVLKACPQLVLEAPTKVAACTSLAYNIGVSAFKDSTVCRKTMVKDYDGAADGILLWNKVKNRTTGKLVVSNGLDNRRKIEKDLYKSVSV